MIGAVLTAMAAIAGTCSAATVQLGGIYVAEGAAYTTSRGDSCEHFAGIPYATRSRPFEMPQPVRYRHEFLHSGALFSGIEHIYTAMRHAEMRVVNPANRLRVAESTNCDVIMPTPSVPWTGADYTPDDSSCMQLDIFRPAERRTDAPLRVVVYVHGGMLDVCNRADTAHRGDDFLRSLHADDEFGRETLLVTVEYSLGAYGWWYPESGNEASGHTEQSDGIDGTLTARVGDTMGATRLDRSDDSYGPVLTQPSNLAHVYGSHPPNLALHQVIQALLWVQQHISKFGGNPNDVTLAGQSAGAAMVHWVHLVLTSRTMATYGFEFPPFSKLMLIGGTALLFDAVHPRDALAIQDAALAVAGTSSVYTLTSDQLAKACTESKVFWSPVIDGVLVRGTFDDLKRRTAYMTDNDWFTDVRVLTTVATQESAVFCLRFRHAIAANYPAQCSKFGLSSDATAKVLSVDPELAMNSPLEHSIMRCNEVVFTIPAFEAVAAYAAAGAYARVILLDSHFNADMHALITSKADALARNFAYLSLDTVRSSLRIAAMLNEMLTAVQMYASPSLDTLRSFVSPQNTIEEKGEMVESSPRFTSYSQLSIAQIERLLHKDTFASAARSLEEQLQKLRVSHMLDQCMMFNARTSYGNVTLSFDELTSPSALERIVIPLRTFIAEGVARMPDGSEPPEPIVADHEALQGVSVRELLRSAKYQPLFSDADHAEIIEALLF